MTIRDQEEFQNLVKAYEESFEKAGPFQKFIYYSKDSWLRVNMRFPILIPAILGSIVAAIVLQMLDWFDPGPPAPDYNPWELLIVYGIILLLVIWPLTKRNLKFIEFAQKQMDDEKEIGK